MLIEVFHCFVVRFSLFELDLAVCTSQLACQSFSLKRPNQEARIQLSVSIDTRRAGTSTDAEHCRPAGCDLEFFFEIKRTLIESSPTTIDSIYSRLIHKKTMLIISELSANSEAETLSGSGPSKDKGMCRRNPQTRFEPDTDFQIFFWFFFRGFNLVRSRSFDKSKSGKPTLFWRRKNVCQANGSSTRPGWRIHFDSNAQTRRMLFSTVPQDEAANCFSFFASL